MIARLADMLGLAQRVLVVAHHDPDGDALGSSLGLMHLLLARGQEVFVHNAGPLPQEYAFLPGLERLSGDLPPTGWAQLAVMLDCHQAQRCGPLAEAYLAGVERLAVVDHHQGQPQEGQLRWVDPQYAAASEMITLLALEAGYEITPAVATCLFTGLQTDTGSFRYANTTGRALRLAGELVERGADPRAISQEVYAISPCRLRMLGRVAQNLSLQAGGRLAVSQVARADFSETGCGPQDLEQAVEQMRDIRGVEVALLLREQDDGRVKVSMRSRGDLDVSQLARSLGGGGHRNAAGASLALSLEAARGQLGGMLLERLGVQA